MEIVEFSAIGYNTKFLMFACTIGLCKAVYNQKCALGFIYIKLKNLCRRMPVSLANVSYSL